MTEPLTLSVAETAAALGVSDDLIYELLHRGVLPCVRFGRRRLVPRAAIERIVDEAVKGFDPAAVRTLLHSQAASVGTAQNQP